MNLENIALLSFGNFEAGFLEKLAEDLKSEFSFDVKVIEKYLDLSEYYDAGRGQYNANLLLKAVDSLYSTEYFKAFGIFNVDLFIPILTYIFGQAFLSGRTGIASTYRLNNERYGMKRDERILLERFTKEVIHEAGHTFGLLHCHNPECVMLSSTYVEDVDQKSHHLCPNCRNLIYDLHSLELPVKG